MTALLAQNSKLRKSTGKRTFNFGIPAYRSASGQKTCPNAGACAKGCYARSGAYMFGNVKPAYESRLSATGDADFGDRIRAEVRAKRVERVRVHDSGDFYSEGYLYRWVRIANSLPDVEFYAYTKMVSMLRFAQAQPGWPPNFTIIYSFGGTEDKKIDVKRERHSRVFQSRAELLREGYADASDDDNIALGPNPKVGLVYHGAKNFDNTDWSKVKHEPKK